MTTCFSFENFAEQVNQNAEKVVHFCHTDSSEEAVNKTGLGFVSPS